MSRTRQWYYDGATIPGATGKTVVVGAGQLNAALWECRTQVDYGADSVAALAGIGGASAVPYTGDLELEGDAIGTDLELEGDAAGSLELEGNE